MLVDLQAKSLHFNVRKIFFVYFSSCLLIEREIHHDHSLLLSLYAWLMGDVNSKQTDVAVLVNRKYSSPEGFHSVWFGLLVFERMFAHRINWLLCKVGYLLFTHSTWWYGDCLNQGELDIILKFIVAYIDIFQKKKNSNNNNQNNSGRQQHQQKTSNWGTLASTKQTPQGHKNIVLQ